MHYQLLIINGLSIFAYMGYKSQTIAVKGKTNELFFF
jgi:hypothetical protein